MIQEIQDSLKKYLDTDFTESFDFMTANLQEAGETGIVFYRLYSNDKAYEAFCNRMKESSAGLVIVVGDFQYELPNRCYKLDIEKANELKYELLDILYPRNEIKLVAVTGTNGKTSVVHFCREIARQRGIKAASLGTLGAYIGDEMIEDLGLTTPSEIDFRRLLFQFHKKNVDVVFFEISSHALKQKRLGKLKVDQGAWTNFTQDHLDFHETMDDYFESKKTSS